jgi:hypothetical protein
MALERDDVTSLATALTGVIGPLLAQMQQQTAAMIAQMQESNAQMLAELVRSQRDSNTLLAAEARKNKRPESYLNDFPEPLANAFMPDGEPLPKLKCPAELGYWEEDEGTGAMMIRGGFPYIDEPRGGSTREERDLLNGLEAGVYRARRRDGAEGVVRVVVKHDADNSPIRLTVAVPKSWLSREGKNVLGGVELLKQLQPAVARAAAA